MIDYQYVLATIARDSSSRGWNEINDPETGEKLAEWMLDNPYTGPAKASDPTNGWVHYCCGGLKIRYKKSLDIGDGISVDVIRVSIGSDADDFKFVQSRKYGVHYAIPAEHFQSAQGLQDYVATRVTEFIENRDSYYMAEGDSYPWGKSMGK